MTTRSFAIIGVGGYVAPRHLRAIRDTGNRLAAALDPHDAVGVLDQYFDDVPYFREFERFDRHVERLRREGSGQRVEAVSICSPNYLHDAHVRFALRVGADAICEKPLVLNPWNLDALEELEAETAGRVHTILQLRLHPSIVALRRRVAEAAPGRRFSVDLSYVTARGPWYDTSWKGDPEKSGGIATNIGVHFFDMLLWIFGPCHELVLEEGECRRAAGVLHLERADVRWLLSIEGSDLPDSLRPGQRSFRSLRLDGDEIEFSDGFTGLHTEAYRDILSGGGFGIADARPSIELVHAIRTAPLRGARGLRARRCPAPLPARRARRAGASRAAAGHTGGVSSLGLATDLASGTTEERR